MLLVARVRWASAMQGHRRRLDGAGEVAALPPPGQGQGAPIVTNYRGD